MCVCVCYMAYEVVFVIAVIAGLNRPKFEIGGIRHGNDDNYNYNVTTELV